MSRRKANTEDIEHLYLQAVNYTQKGDVYNAVKLSKKAIKLSPDWSAPFSLLSMIYKTRSEWHPSLYYSRKAIEINPFDESAWQNLAIAATALKKWLIARNAWNHLGFEFPKNNKAIKMNLGRIPVRINSNSKPEIIWATRIDPARAIIESIPQPSSDRRFQDVVLVDATVSGYHIKNGKKIPVYDELQLLKPSRKWTFVTLLKTSNPADILALDRLCAKARLGFDNWSNASRQSLSPLNNSLPEYYDRSHTKASEKVTSLIAIAGEWKTEVREILEAWKIVTLKDYEGLRCVLKW